MAVLKKPAKIVLGKGLKRTPQRLAILEFLKGNTAHPSAEEIYRAVSKKYHSMSFATVYNTLKTLTENGVLRELTVDPERRRYDPDTSSHHHFYCVQCRKILDVTADIRAELPAELARECSLFGTHVEFTGLCGSCKKKKRTQ